MSVGCASPSATALGDRRSVHSHRFVAIGLLLVTMIGGGLRFHSALHRSPYQSADERAYARLALAVAERGEYDDPGVSTPAHWPPGAPLMFALTYTIHRDASADDPPDVPSAYVAQALVSTLTIPATFGLGAVFGGPLAGVIACSAVAFYPPLFRSPSDLLTEPLAGLVLACALLAMLTSVRRLSVRRAFLAAGLLGLAALVRSDLSALPVLLAFSAALLARQFGLSFRRACMVAGVALVIAVAPILAWSTFASVQAGHVVAVTAGRESDLFVGTYLPGHGRIFGAKAALAAEARRHNPRLQETRAANIPLHEIADAVAARHPRLSRSEALRREALANVWRYSRHEPLRYLGMVAGKVWRLWGIPSLGGHRDFSPMVRSIHLLLVGLSLVGVLLALSTPVRPQVLLLGVVLLYVTALNAMFIAEPRHNLPALPVLFAAGATGWAAFRGTLRESSARKSGVAARRRLISRKARRDVHPTAPSGA